MSTFSPEEQELLEQYVTNTEGDVYAVKNLSGIVGAVYARYSRAKTGFRETLLREFIKEGNLDIERADDLIQRVLIAYGDDSVGELEGGHLSFENISMIATKEIEDRRIGGSPIEKSTRYVFFDVKDEEDNYLYVREPLIMASSHADEYIEVMDFIFDTYSELVEPMQEFYKKRFPFEEAEYDVTGSGEKKRYDELGDEKSKKSFEITYRMDIRTKACDTLRCLLPLSTKTNVGLFGNGRFWQWLISHLLSTPYPETIALGKQAHAELSKVIPQYVRRAARKEYNMAIDEAMTLLAQELFASIEVEKSEEPAILVPPEHRDKDEYLVAHMLYPYISHPFIQIYREVEKMSDEVRLKIKNTYVGERKSRRDRPGRAFESGYIYTVDLMADFGTYKDLMRHRMTTQLRQPFSPLHGLIIPEDLIEAGFKEKADVCQEKVVALYNKLLPEVGPAASYVALHGSRIRWLMGFNDREAHHLLELRTTPQGHPQYRKLSQLMHKAIEEYDPWRADVMKFVDYTDYNSARGDSEAKQRVKERQLEENNNA